MFLKLCSQTRKPSVDGHGFYGAYLIRSLGHLGCSRISIGFIAVMSFLSLSVFFITTLDCLFRDSLTMIKLFHLKTNPV